MKMSQTPLPVHTVPRIAKTVRENNLAEDVHDILRVLRKNWMKNEASRRAIKSRELSGGLTNKLYVYFQEGQAAGEMKDAVVIKIFGAQTDSMIDRDKELETMTLLNQYECGPKLYGTFENGMVYEFLPGKILNTETVRSPIVYPLVARELAREHKLVQIPQKYGYGSHLWRKLNSFITLLEDIFRENGTLKDKLLKKCGFSLTKARNAVEEMEAILTKQKMPLGYCHNDLLLGNILYNNSKDTSKVTFIDFEYAFPNYLPYDVANHFNEFGGIMDPDFSKIPGPEFRRKWIEVYLDELKPQRSYKLEDFERWVYFCIPASHFFWTLWAIIQTHNSELDFGYEAYAGLRFREYERCMDILHGRKLLSAMIKQKS